MSVWTIACFVVFAVSAGLALYFGIDAPNPTGTYASYVCYAMLFTLIVFAVIGGRHDHRTTAPKTKKAAPALTKREVTTAAGSIKMASG